MPDRANRPRTMADTADRYRLYQQAVQHPDFEVGFVSRVYRGAYGRTATVLREDFCGTAFLSSRWVASRPERTALGLDLDPEPLAWGAANNLAALEDDERARVTLLQQDVRSVTAPRAHVAIAGNFSFNAFTRRADILDYFRCVHASLDEQAIFMLDVLGGPELQRERSETRRDELSFHYVWEQRSFDPVTHRGEFAIHFEFADGSALKDAFVYPWRVWTLPELRDLLDEAGFSDSAVYWEMTDPRTGRGKGVFRPVNEAPAQECWLAELVAFR